MTAINFGIQKYLGRVDGKRVEKWSRDDVVFLSFQIGTFAFGTSTALRSNLYITDDGITVSVINSRLTNNRT